MNKQDFSTTAIFFACLWLLIGAQENSPIGFTAASDHVQTFTGNSSVNRVQFSSVVSNVGNGFNPNTNIFTTPLAGTYYMSMTGGVQQGEPVAYFLAHVGTPDVRLNIGIRNNNSFPNGSDMTSRGILGDLAPNVQYVMVAEGGTSLFATPENHLTSWTMFRYEDISKTLVAFSAVKVSSIDGIQVPIIFDEYITNIRDGPLNMSTGTFEARISGIYFFHVSSGGYQEREIRLNLRHRRGAVTSLMGQLARTTLNTNGVDTVSRSILLLLNVGDQISVSSSFGSYLYSDDGFQTSFSGLGYALEGNPSAVAVFAARRSNWNDSFTFAPVAPWETVNVVQPSDCFDPNTGLFIAPLPGTYFISFGAGVMARTAVGLILYHDGVFVAKIERTSTAHQGIDQLSRDVILDLNVGDQLHLEAQPGTGLFSDVGLQTYFLVMRLRLLQ